MAVQPKDLRKGSYYQLGAPMEGILRFSSTNIPQALVYGEVLDTKTGGISHRGVKLDQIVKTMSSDRVYHFQRQFIKSLLDF